MCVLYTVYVDKLSIYIKLGTIIVYVCINFVRRVSRYIIRHSSIKVWKFYNVRIKKYMGSEVKGFTIERERERKVCVCFIYM